MRELVSEVYIARAKVLAFRPTKAAEVLFLAAEQRLDWRPIEGEILTSGGEMGRLGIQPKQGPEVKTPSILRAEVLR